MNTNQMSSLFLPREENKFRISQQMSNEMDEPYPLTGYQKENYSTGDAMRANSKHRLFREGEDSIFQRFPRAVPGGFQRKIICLICSFLTSLQIEQEILLLRVTCLKT